MITPVLTTLKSAFCSPSSAPCGAATAHSPPPHANTPSSSSQTKKPSSDGAAGGGKSVALLMAALQYADVPGYHALLLRPTLGEFQLPGGLLELSHDWLAD